ncbi:MAG TPA: GyrI-like domain-containing protein [Pseudobacteroides sp.]|uniref:GyrI-like domain-containing protein n=1 Tax=Pseudobacteroides sp. TaxID=1968840 RepID=UPI002F92EB47
MTIKKIDYKKAFKDLYLPKNSPCIIEVPSIKFATIDGTGDPNGEEFALATAALYSFSYAVKMSYKSKEIPEGFYDYTVFPLEGVWDLVDKTKSITDKSNYAYSVMIRQPEFLTDELFERFISETKKKKPNDYLDKIKYSVITEGMCCQMLHLGTYDDEPGSFKMMEQFCRDRGYERSSLKHREIYLSDPRKTEVDKLKTVLRFKVRQK